MSWDTADVGSVVALELRKGEDIIKVQARVSGDATPSFVLGDDACQGLFQAGWAIDEAGWLLGTDDADDWAPEEVDGDMVFGGDAEVGMECGDDAESEAYEEAWWARWQREHQLRAVDGDEPGGLVTG